LCKRGKKVWSFGAVQESFEEYLRKKCYFYIEIVDRCNKKNYNEFRKFDIETKRRHNGQDARGLPSFTDTLVEWAYLSKTAE